MTLPAKDGYELALRIYEADEPKAVVVIEPEQKEE